MEEGDDDGDSVSTKSTGWSPNFYKLCDGWAEKVIIIDWRHRTDIPPGFTGLFRPTSGFFITRIFMNFCVGPFCEIRVVEFHGSRSRNRVFFVRFLDLSGSCISAVQLASCLANPCRGFSWIFPVFPQFRQIFSGIKSRFYFPNFKCVTSWFTTRTRRPPSTTTTFGDRRRPPTDGSRPRLPADRRGDTTEVGRQT